MWNTSYWLWANLQWWTKKKIHVLSLLSRFLGVITCRSVIPGEKMGNRYKRTEVICSFYIFIRKLLISIKKRKEKYAIFPAQISILFENVDILWLIKHNQEEHHQAELSFRTRLFFYCVVHRADSFANFNFVIWFNRL